MKNFVSVLSLSLSMLFSTVSGYSETISTTFNIYPTEVWTTINNRKTASYTLTNTTNSPVIIHVMPDFLRVGKYGQSGKSPYMNDQMIGNSNDEQFTLLDVQVSEPYVIVRPRQNKIVRVSFSVSPDAVPGTYRANVIFSPEVSTAKNQTNIQKKNKSTDLGIHVQYVVAQEVSIYANKGTGDAESTTMTCNYDRDANQFVLKIKNTTNWVFNPEVSIYSNSKSDELNHNKIIPVMPKTVAQRKITASVNQTNSPFYIIWKLSNSEGHKVNCS